jgi:hypothetical protein
MNPDWRTEKYMNQEDDVLRNGQDQKQQTMTVNPSSGSFFRRFEAVRVLGENVSWWWEVILAPFLVVRLVDVLAAAFARGSIQPNPTYLKYFQQGGQLTRVFWLDIFAHWDAKYYLSIIQNGYSSATDLSQYSNVAFYPLYPYLVKSIGWLGIHLPDAVYLFLGILISNLCFLLSLALLYRLTVKYLGLKEFTARGAVILILVFPASFIFSCFYPESLFLLLSLLAFTAAFERRWLWAGIAGALVTLTRIQGVLVVAAVAWMYMDARQWNFKAIRADVLWFGLAPLGLLAHFYSLYRITGHWLAPFEAQAAWGRGQYGFFEGLGLQLSGMNLDVFKVDAVFLLLFLGVGVVLLFSPKLRPLGIYTLLMGIVPVSTGLLVSVSRFLAVVFPGFIWLADQTDHRSQRLLYLAALFFGLQVLYFAAWANFYWIA